MMLVAMVDDDTLSARADDLLWRWGDWSRHYFGLGYPRESVIGRVMREGPGAGHATVKAEIPIPPDVARAESAVLAMDGHIRQAVKYCYIQRMTIRDGAKRCRCSQTEYRDRIKRAVGFVAGWLAAT